MTILVFAIVYYCYNEYFSLLILLYPLLDIFPLSFIQSVVVQANKIVLIFVISVLLSLFLVIKIVGILSIKEEENN